MWIRRLLWIGVTCCILATQIGTSVADECAFCETSSDYPDVTPLCFLGDFRIHTQEPSKAKQAIRCEIKLWRQRSKIGAAAYTVSDAFLVMARIDPADFFKVMSDCPDVFSDWLQMLSGYSFTWRDDPPSPLDGRRLPVQVASHSSSTCI
jgi:hypothetical protein